ncbi:MAG: hypothetical protein KAT70_03870 [Thermoplasmata archaeon]|nr:hypothetical protein [Thermoplasmata archaeon]
MEEAERVYKGLYKLIGNAIGSHAVHEMLQLQENDFDPTKPKESLLTMRNKIAKSFGERTANNMMLVMVRSEFRSPRSDQIIGALELER